MQPKSWAWLARLISLIAIGCVLGVTIAGMINKHFELSTIIRTCDLGFFAFLLFLAEMRLKFFLRYFNFMCSRLGKSVYMIFLGTLILENSTVGLVLGVAVIIMGIAYFFVSSKAEYGDEKEIEEMNREMGDNIEKEMNAQKS